LLLAKQINGWIDAYMINRILSLIWKELLLALRDPKTRIALLLPPIVQLFIFTFAATLDVTNVSIGILNRDNGEQGFELVQRFHGAPVFSRIVYLEGVEEIQPFIDRQRGVMVLSLDQQFSRNLDANLKANVQLILDGRKSNTAQVVASYASSIIEKFNEDYAKRAGIKQQNVKLVSYYLFNHNLIYYWYNIPSLVATLSMLTCLIVTTNSVARERELGTFDQLLVSPLAPMEIVIGKIIPGIIIGSLEGLLLLSVGVFLFKVPFVGSFSLFLLALIVFIGAFGGVGLFVSALASTQQQAMLGTFLIVVPSVLLSGFATPIENMPIWLQPVSYLIPLRYMLIISKGIFLKDISGQVVFNNLWPLIIIACFTLVCAGLLFKRRLE
jgi:ABC-2 type transport system permease protein